MRKIVVAVVSDDKRVLLARRRAPEGTLWWAFPSGAVEQGETEFAAAAREVLEETGVRCKPVAKLGERTHPATHKPCVYVSCHYQGGVASIVDSDELDRVEWRQAGEVSGLVKSGLFVGVRRYLAEVAGDKTRSSRIGGSGRRRRTRRGGHRVLANRAAAGD